MKTLCGNQASLLWKLKTIIQKHTIKTEFLLVSLLSQPLFYTPDEYLVILNPFATFLTCRRSRNVKNLFISLLNVVISYDSTGYVSSNWFNFYFYREYHI